MTRITIEGMTEKEIAEAMANYTEADYLAEQAEAEAEARYNEKVQRYYEVDYMHFLGWESGLS
jgi:hypothetical protein